VPTQRRAWRDAVLTLEAYRARWGIDDPEVAIGEATQAGQRDEWRAAGQAINEARHSIRDTSHTLHVDQDRDLEEAWS
jgi:hypothetical protein